MAPIPRGPWADFCRMWLHVGFRAANPVPRDDHDDPNDSQFTDPVL